MKTFICAIALIALCLSGCRGGGADGSFVVLNLEGAIDNPRTFDLGEIARRVEFIPLDGAVPVDEIGVWMGLQPDGEGGFFIADHDSDAPVQQFDAGGRFVGTVGRIGRGPGETVSVVSASRNPETGEIYIDGVTDVVALDAMGNEFARASGFFSWGMSWYQDRLLTLPVLGPWETEALAADSLPFIDLYDRELKPAGKIMGPNIGNSMGVNGVSSSPVLSDNGKRLLVMQGRGDTLYQYDAGTIRPAYVARLGRYTPPAEVFEIMPAQPWNDRHFAVLNVWEGERWMIVSVSNGSDDEGTVRTHPLFFDRRDPAAGGFSTRGPGRETGLFLGGVKFTPGYVRGGRLVGYMQAFDIVDNAGRITRNDLREVAAGLREDSNPVIVAVELN